MDKMDMLLNNKEAVSEEQLSEISQTFKESLNQGKLNMLDIVKNLDAVLTNLDHEIRLRGLLILSDVIKSVTHTNYNSKQIEVLTKFLCLRLLDHKSMEQPVLECLSYFLDCGDKPYEFHHDLLEFLKTKCNVRKLSSRSRLIVMDIVQKVVIQKRNISSVMTSELIYSVIHLSEGEFNPQNLMVAFKTISYIMKEFTNLEPYAEDIVDWLASYFPVEYTPKTDHDQKVNITRDDLVNALYECFYSSPVIASSLLTFLLSSLKSTQESTRLESLVCLTRCFDTFPTLYVKDYASTMWINSKMNNLKKEEATDKRILEAYCSALTSLAKNLSNDTEAYFAFVSEVTEDLSACLRFPQMGLITVACILITQILRPKFVTFVRVLDSFVPTLCDAIRSDQLESYKGIVYLFQQLAETFPDQSFDDSMNVSLNKLLDELANKISVTPDALKLIKILICLKMTLNHTTIDRIVNNLNDSKDDSTSQECLALICRKFNKSNLVFESNDMSVDFDRLDSVIKYSYYYDKLRNKSNYSEALLRKFAIYLRLVTRLIHECDSNKLHQLNQDDLKAFLCSIRETAIKLNNDNVINIIGRIQGMVVNKLQDSDLTSIMMEIFSSNLCQQLIPTDEDGEELSRQVYIPIIRWILKMLTIRNNNFAAPLKNLLLNLISSKQTSDTLAMFAAEAFSFVYSNDEELILDRLNHYQVFALFKQKFYTQTYNEVLIRYNQADTAKKVPLLCSLVIQLPHLAPQIYQKHYAWYLRGILKTLGDMDTRKLSKSKNSLAVMKQLLCFFRGLEVMIDQDKSEDLDGLLTSYTEICLVYANEAAAMEVRLKALSCLNKMSTSYKEAEVLKLRLAVSDGLRACLSDKKRLVRQAAAETRLQWILVGQPVST